MRQFNLARRSPAPEGEDPDTTIEAPEAPPPGPGKARRLLVIVGAVVVVLGGGYIALMQFTDLLSPRPQPSARPVRPIAKVPAPTGPPAPAVPGVPAPAPAKAEPAAEAPPPAKAPEPAKAAAPPPAAPPAKPAAKAPEPQKKAEPVQVAKVPAEPRAALAPPPARPGPAEAVAGTFSVQVGAMIEEANAQRLKARLEQLGYQPLIRKGQVHVRRHTVTTGDFADRGAAEEAAKRLAGHGVKGRAVAAGERFTVEAGSFANEDDAIDLARQLQRLNYPPRIQDQTQKTTIYQVRVGAFSTRAEAQAQGSEIGRKMNGKGFRYFVVKN